MIGNGSKDGKREEGLIGRELKEFAAKGKAEGRTSHGAPGYGLKANAFWGRWGPTTSPPLRGPKKDQSFLAFVEGGIEVWAGEDSKDEFGSCLGERRQEKEERTTMGKEQKRKGWDIEAQIGNEQKQIYVKVFQFACA